MKIFKKLSTIILSLSIMTSSVSAFAYSDCDSDAVITLTELNVLSGYDDGTFKPAALLTRAEFAKMISLVNGGPEVDGSPVAPPVENPFTDVTVNHWAYSYILHCNALELIDGYEDGSFNPNENVSLAEAVKICLSAIGYNNLITEDTENWYEPWIDTAYDYKLIESKDIDPNEKISRLSAAILVSRTIKLPICYVTGYDFSTGKAVIQFDFADGTVDENGKAKPYSTLLTKHLQ